MNSTVIKKIGCPLIIVVVGWFVCWTAASAADMPFYWGYINVNIDLQANGDMEVTETQNYVFTEDYSNQRYRYIPLQGIGGIADVSVQENGKSLPIQTGVENNQLWIRWQHTLNAPEEHVFVLKYRVTGGLKFEGDHARAYWKAIFPDRKSAVLQAKVRVQLPDALASKVITFTHYGVPATVQEINPRVFEFVASTAIQPQQELAVELVFPAKLIALTQSTGQNTRSKWKDMPDDFYAAGQQTAQQQQDLSQDQYYKYPNASYLLAFILFLIVVWLLSLAKDGKRREYIRCYQFNPELLDKLSQHYPHLTQSKMEQAQQGLRAYFVSVHPLTPAMARGPILGADGLWRFASIPRGNGRAGGRCR